MLYQLLTSPKEESGEQFTGETKKLYSTIVVTVSRGRIRLLATGTSLFLPLGHVAQSVSIVTLRVGFRFFCGVLVGGLAG